MPIYHMPKSLTIGSYDSKPFEHGHGLVQPVLPITDAIEIKFNRFSENDSEILSG